jgi:hypothetical protein
VFPVRYELNFYILFRKKPVFKRLIPRVSKTQGLKYVDLKVYLLFLNCRETWSVALSKQHKFRGLGNRDLRKIFGSERETERDVGEREKYLICPRQKFVSFFSIKHHVMKKDGGNGGIVPSGQLHGGSLFPRYPLDRRLDGPRAGLDAV